MARKGKNKKKKKTPKPRQYNKKQFIEVFCVTCGLCDKQKNPSFCYVELYRHSPRDFVNAVWKNLTDVGKHYKSAARLPSTMSVEQFRNIFCCTGICDNGDMDISMACNQIDNCYQLFKVQMGALTGFKIKESGGTVIPPAVVGRQSVIKKKKYTAYQKRKKRKRVVYTTYPTFYSRKDKTFQDWIQKTLYGDNNNEQDTGKEPAREDTAAASGDSEDRKP